MHTTTDEHVVHAADPRDAGFALVEVIVALVLLGVVASAVLPFFVQGVAKGAEVQRTQAAVAVANSIMETTAAVVARNQEVVGADVTGLVLGRLQANVQTQWNAGTAPELAQTHARWDPAATAASVPAVPLATTDRVSNEAYTTQVYIGTCYRDRASRTGPCGKVGTTVPVSPPTGKVEMVRVIVETRWTPNRGSSCGAAGCVYRTSSLVNPSTDPRWNTGAGRAVDDVALVRRNQTVTVNVLANDPVVTWPTSPVDLVDPVPANATVNAAGAVTYKATGNPAVGSVIAISYRVRNAAGVYTDPAILRVTVAP